MLIDIYADPICPWCYIGKRRLERAVRARPDLRIRTRWRPFQLNPEMPEQGMDRNAYLSLKFGGAPRARQIYAHIARVGDSEAIGFAFDNIRETPNTLNAHRLIRYAERADASDAVVERLFAAYFVEGRSIGDPGSLADLGAEAGLQRNTVLRHLEGDADRETIIAEDIQARRAGIQGVPCFIVDHQYALSGAQEPEAFFPIFEVATQQPALE